MQLEKLPTVRAVVAMLGGPAAVMRLTGQKYQSGVNNWMALNRFSGRVYLVINTALRPLGYEAPPELFGIDPAQPNGIAAIARPPHALPADEGD